MDDFLVQRAARRLAAVTAACPDDDTLAAALEGRLDPAEIAEHVRSCPACTAIATDFQALQAQTCPSLQQILKGEGSEHLAFCRGCAEIAEMARQRPAEATALLDLLEAETRARALGAALSATAVLAALLRRRASLGVAAQGRIHRSREGSLGRTAARPRQLDWTPFGLDEDTYDVTLGGVRLKTHEPHAELPEAMAPDQDHAWSVTALRSGRPLETRHGVVRFLSSEEEAEVSRQEAAVRDLPVERRMLALAGLYRGGHLYAAASAVLNDYVRRRPDTAIGHLLLGLVYEEMERVQDAARVIGEANRLLTRSVSG